MDGEIDFWRLDLSVNPLLFRAISNKKDATRPPNEERKKLMCIRLGQPEEAATKTCSDLEAGEFGYGFVKDVRVI